MLVVVHVECHSGSMLSQIEGLDPTCCVGILAGPRACLKDKPGGGGGGGGVSGLSSLLVF